jgi:hypothetical protein
MHKTQKMRAVDKNLERRYAQKRGELRRAGNPEQVRCIAKLDRFVLTAVALVIQELSAIPGYRAIRTKRVWGQLYREVTRIYGTSSIRQVIVESAPNVGWVPKYRITIVPRDSSGLLFNDLRFILELIPRFKIVLMEIALDFPIQSLLDLPYIRRHLLFGKTWLRSGTNALYERYGSAGSRTIVRCYVKFELSTFRIELQLHARFLRRHSINHTSDFAKLAQILPTRHIYFAELDSAKLRKQLLRTVPSRTRRNEILKAVAARKTSLWATLRYLRGTAKLTNVRRFLIPLVSINNIVSDALAAWALQWSSSANRLTIHGEKE